MTIAGSGIIYVLICHFDGDHTIDRVFNLYVVDLCYQESDEEMDDEAMFRLDDALSAAFRSMRKGKKSKEDKEKAMQLKHYKMRSVICHKSVRDKTE